MDYEYVLILLGGLLILKILLDKYAPPFMSRKSQLSD